MCCHPTRYQRRHRYSCASNYDIIRSFTRINIDNVFYSIKKWHESSRRDDTAIMFRYEKQQRFFGKIVKIFQVDHNFKLFIETLSCEPVSDSIVLPCIYKVTGSSSIVVINSRYFRKMHSNAYGKS